MQLSLIFPASIQIPRTMPQMHVNMARHRIAMGEIKLLDKSTLELGLCRFKNLETGQVELVEVVKTIHL